MMEKEHRDHDMHDAARKMCAKKKGVNELKKNRTFEFEKVKPGGEQELSPPFPIDAPDPKSDRSAPLWHEGQHLGSEAKVEHSL